MLTRLALFSVLLGTATSAQGTTATGNASVELVEAATMVREDEGVTIETPLFVHLHEAVRPVADDAGLAVWTLAEFE